MNFVRAHVVDSVPYQSERDARGISGRPSKPEMRGCDAILS